MTCRASNLCNVPWDLWCPWTSVLCVSVGRSCIHCSNDLSDRYKHVQSIWWICQVKFDRRYLPITPGDSNNFQEAKERSTVSLSNDSLLGFP